MTVEDDDPIVELDRSAQVLRGPPDELWILRGNRNFKLRGVDAGLLREALALADGKRSVASISAVLADSYGATQVADALTALRGVLWHPKNDHERPTRQLDIVLVIGSGGLFNGLHAAMRRAGMARTRFIAPRSFASCLAPTFRAAEQAQVVWNSPEVAPGEAEPLEDVEACDAITVNNLVALCEEATIVVCSLEDFAVRALLDIEEACAKAKRPCVFVTARGPDDVLIGPACVAGVTAGASAWLRDRIARHCDPSVFPLIRLPMLAAQPALLESACAEVVAATRHLLGRRLNEYAVSLVSLSARGTRVVEPMPLAISEPTLAASTNVTGEFEDPVLSQAVQAIGRSWITPIEAGQPETDPDAYRSVGILGGGTAGYLTALALRARRPELDVTLIESSKIPVIGVGEASTPELVRFLHNRRFLALDVLDFYRRVTPTWKLGIKFQWGLADDYFFTFPFQRGRLLESHQYCGHLNHQSLGAVLMKDDRVPVFALETGQHESHLAAVRFAYHLENRRFVRYLREEALRRGVKHLDCVVTDAAVVGDAPEIECLLTEDGQRLKFDLYVDCSGFRSLLMGRKLGSPFLPYQQTLMTDTAIAAGVPHNGVVKPYTLAETMDHGWCWNIPFEDEDHRGYVFSSAFASVDQAMEEMRRKNPDMHDPFVVQFRSGRHEHFWKENVIAIGNAHAFVEPLESTAIHMMVLELDLLTSHFPASRRDVAIKKKLNQRIGERWDALRWFLGVHYKFNRRLQTPFWREANASTDITGAQERLALFRERAPLSYRRPLFYPVVPPEFFSDDHSFDTILLGQKVEANLVAAEPKAEWTAKFDAISRLARRAMGQREALELLRQRPELLLQFIADQQSWVHQWLPT